jgi:hypothetical protein
MIAGPSRIGICAPWPGHGVAANGSFGLPLFRLLTVVIIKVGFLSCIRGDARGDARVW